MIFVRKNVLILNICFFVCEFAYDMGTALNVEHNPIMEVFVQGISFVGHIAKTGEHAPNFATEDSCGATGL